MTEKTTGGVHWSFWVIAAVALIWNLMGSANFFMQMNSNMVSTLPETHRAIIEGRPFWATGGFAVAVFGGALGGLLLLLKKSAATYLFMASLLGVMLTMIHTLGVAGSAVDFSPMEIFVMVLLPALVVVFLIWYSKLAEKKAWIS